MKSINKIYRAQELFNALTDGRERSVYDIGQIVLMWVSMYAMQFPSLNQFLSKRDGQQKQLQNLLGGGKNVRIPGRDAMEDVAANLQIDELRAILRRIAMIQKKNRALDGCRIDGYLATAIDGIETTKSYLKQCDTCLSRKHKGSDRLEYYHRFVALLYVGGVLHTFLDAIMLRPRDGEDKQEGELTGGKRILEENFELLGHFADVIVADALYFNAPFINLVLKCKMEAVIRLTDETRLPYKEAEKSIRSGHYHASSFKAKNADGHNIEVTVADVREVNMENLEQEDPKSKELKERTIRIIRFIEHDLDDPEAKDKEVWVATTSATMKAETVWKIMHARWEIENNGFHQISTYYNVKHLYCHDAVEQCFFLALIGFNFREAYLERTRGRDFRKSGLTRIDITFEFRESLLVSPIQPCCHGSPPRAKASLIA